VKGIMDGHQIGKIKSALGGPVMLVIATSGAASLYAWLVFATTFVWPGMIGINYNAVGSDWMVFHAAASSYLSGHQASIYDGSALTDLINNIYISWVSAPLPFRPWVYPPTYLLLIVPFGFLSFLGSFLVFQILTSTALVAAIVVGAPRKAWRIAGCAILSPAAAVNAVCGQNSVLIAALLLGGFRLLRSHPVFAGALLGLLTFKPQFAVLAPVALVASKQWRPLSAFIASSLSLALISLMVFGFDAWAAWVRLTIQSMASPSSEWIEYGRIWGYSVWTCAVLLGATSNEASVLQFAAFIISLGAVGLAFARPLDVANRLAALLAATCLAAPHWSQYDAVLLAAGGLLWLQRKPTENAPLWRWILFLLLWLLPLFGPPAVDRLAFLAPVLIVSFLAAVICSEQSALPAAISRGQTYRPELTLP
jgi:alpha-1,2-mannosyltransferase